MHDFIVQEARAAHGQPAGLFLLFHGVGSDAEALRGLGEAIAAGHPQAWVVSVQSPDPSDLGRGWQWFSVQGIMPVNRSGRVAATMPRFLQAIAHWQRQTGVGAEQTALVGFSQGAIMALEATQQMSPVAARVAALAGRFAAPPQRADVGCRVHLLHGKDDAVVPAQASVEAHAQLAALRTPVSLDVFPGLAHGIDGRMVSRLLERLASVD